MAQKAISAVSVTSFEYGVKSLRRLAKAQANIIEEVQVNGTKVNPSDKKVNISVPTKVSEITNDSKYQTESQVDTKISAAISSTYKPGGTKAAADITASLLVAANEGKVYNLTDDLTITDDTKGNFVENKAQTIPAGANICVIDTGTGGTPAYKFDILQGLQDLSGYLTPEDITVTDVETTTIDGWINGDD